MSRRFLQRTPVRTRSGDKGLRSPLLAHFTPFSPTVSQASLLRLYHRFQALDREEKGYLR